MVVTYCYAMVTGKETVFVWSCCPQMHTSPHFSVIPRYTDLGLQLGDGRGLGLTPSIACFAERHLEVAISRAVKHSMLGKDNIWSLFLLMGASNHLPMAPECQHLLYLRIKTRINSRISCLALKKKTYSTCCSTHKSIFLIDVAPFKGK